MNCQYALKIDNCRFEMPTEIRIAMSSAPSLNFVIRAGTFDYLSYLLCCVWVRYSNRGNRDIEVVWARIEKFE